VKIESLLSLVSDSILSSRLFESDRLLRDSKRVLISSVKKLIDLVTNRV
jgi:hypothetical protein